MPRRTGRPAGLGIVSSLLLRRSAYFHISEFARDIGRDVRPADYDTRRQSLLLIPPATPLRLAQETQMLSIRENAHATSERSVLKRRGKQPLKSDAFPFITVVFSIRARFVHQCSQKN
jgi:hypothetical protein